MVNLICAQFCQIKTKGPKKEVLGCKRYLKYYNLKHIIVFCDLEECLQKCSSHKWGLFLLLSHPGG